MSYSRFNPIHYLNTHVITPTVTFAKNIVLNLHANAWLDSALHYAQHITQPITTFGTPHLRANIASSLLAAYVLDFEEGFFNAAFIGITTTFLRDLLLRSNHATSFNQTQIAEFRDVLAITLSVNVRFVLDVTRHLSDTQPLSISDNLMLYQHLMMYLVNMLTLLGVGAYRNNYRVTLFQIPMISQALIAPSHEPPHPTLS